MNFKKLIYITIWAILMLAVSFIVHAGIEIELLKYQEAHNITPHWVKVFGDASCALPVWLIYFLPIAFVAFGIWCGFFFWKKVYIEHLLEKK